MISDNKTLFSFDPEVKDALECGKPVLGLETTILSHGMPFPENLEFAKKAERTVRSSGAVPAVIALIDGRIKIGLSDHDLEQITASGKAVKVGARDLGYAIHNKLLGATTVSSTIRLASLAGIPICATGGIGGVHPGFNEIMDVSQDLIELSRTSVVLVSSGAKAILDIPKTLEYLETFSVPILGYKTESFPVFYSRTSSYKVSFPVWSPEEVAGVFQNHRGVGSESAVLVANPVPKEFELLPEETEGYIKTALNEAGKNEITGKDLTPFLLRRLFELSGGKTQSTNQALALNNYSIGAEIAVAWAKIS